MDTTMATSMAQDRGFHMYLRHRHKMTAAGYKTSGA